MDIVKLCMEKGAANAQEIPLDKIVFQPELRDYCMQNRCGLYGKNYTCPPFIGDVNQLIFKLKTFKKAVIWQNIFPLEDSFDIEGMMYALQKHNAMTMEIARCIYSVLGRSCALVLAAGGCVLCEKCAVVTDEPCRFPEEALSSLEAYGINVSKIVEASGMKYINEQNTVTYFSGVFL